MQFPINLCLGIFLRSYIVTIGYETKKLSSFLFLRQHVNRILKPNFNYKTAKIFISLVSAKLVHSW